MIRSAARRLWHGADSWATRGTSQWVFARFTDGQLKEGRHYIRELLLYVIEQAVFKTFIGAKTRFSESI